MSSPREEVSLKTYHNQRLGPGYGSTRERGDVAESWGLEEADCGYVKRTAPGQCKFSRCSQYLSSKKSVALSLTRTSQWPFLHPSPRFWPFGWAFPPLSLPTPAHSPFPSISLFLGHLTSTFFFCNVEIHGSFCFTPSLAKLCPVSLLFLTKHTHIRCVLKQKKFPP